MSLDLDFIASVLASKDFLACREKGIKKDDIDGDVIPIWKFVEEYYETYRATPSRELVCERFGLDIPEAKESLVFWIAEVKRRSMFNRLNDLFIKVQPHMNKSDSTSAYDEVRNFIKNEERNIDISSPIVNISSLKEAVWQRYLDAKAGKMGIPTPWRTMTAWTMGWWPKDISFLMGRSGLGKTWLAALIANCAVDNNHKTLFVSAEMTKEDVASRAFALKYKKQYGDLRKGRLGFFEEDALRTELNKEQAMNLDIMDGSGGMAIENVERAIERTDAPFVVIDAAYRIKARQRARDRFENMAYVVDDLKTFATVYGKSIVATSQLNRSAVGKKSGAGQEDVALTDVISWNSTNLMSMRMHEDKEHMEVYPIKVREGENSGDPMRMKWDFLTMDFEEIAFIPSKKTSDDDFAGNL